ncbi:hypothetical protein D9M68_753130 [compost metagenome]
MARHAMLRQEGGAGRHHAADGAQRLRHQRRVFERADADADVDALFEQVHRAVVQPHAAAHLLVALHETHDGRRHVHVAEQHRRGDDQLPRGFARLGLQRLVGGVGREQHLARARQVVAALLGE